MFQSQKPYLNKKKSNSSLGNQQIVKIYYIKIHSTVIHIHFHVAPAIVQFKIT